MEKLTDREEAGQVNEQVDVMEDELFQVGEIIAFRGTDSYSFNLLQVKKEFVSTILRQGLVLKAKF